MAFEDLGLLAAVMEAEGWDISFCEAAIDDLQHSSIRNADLLVVLGGPIGAYEVEAYPFLKAEISLLEYRLARNLPTLGICLGAQMIAKALGSLVFAGPVKEIGWGSVALTEQGKTSCLAPIHDTNASSCIGTAIRSIFLPARNAWLTTTIMRIRLLHMGKTYWRCSFIWKQDQGSSRNGTLAMPWNWRQRRYRSPT